MIILKLALLGSLRIAFSVLQRLPFALTPFPSLTLSHDVIRTSWSFFRSWKARFLDLRYGSAAERVLAAP
jgi:hypothetical protein